MTSTTAAAPSDAMKIRCINAPRFGPFAADDLNVVVEC
jgi:hypothetical protein